MEKKLTRAEFDAAVQAAGAKLKPEVLADPAMALKKMPSKARAKLLGELGLPGGGKFVATVEGEHVVLRADVQDRFAAKAAAPAREARGRLGGLLRRKKAPEEPAVAPPGAPDAAQPPLEPEEAPASATAGAAPEPGTTGGLFHDVMSPSRPPPAAAEAPPAPPGQGPAGGAAALPEAPGSEPARAKGGLLAGLRRGKAKAPVEAPAANPAAAPGILGQTAADGKGPVWKTALPPGQEELDVYPVNAPFAWVRIVKDVAQHQNVYQVLEPPLDEREQRVLVFLEDTLVDVLEIPLSSLIEKQAERVLLDHVNQIIFDYSIPLEEESKAKLFYFVLRDFLGFGLIDAIMRDDKIEDVSCDGPHVPIFLYHRKYESLVSNVQFMTHDALDGFVIRLAQRSGKHISIAEPLLDATLPDGSRLNATLSDEVTSAGSTYTVRKFRQVPFTPTDLVRFGTMSVEMLAYWWLAVQYGASAIYAGGTASGKTTSLNAILLFIPPTMKIVSIEDTRELNLPHPNWIPGITRSGFGPRDSHGRQAGEIDMFTLLKAALRQRPEYILVGEVRGQEASALFQAMATGHIAYGTMHADSVEAVIHRLESEPINVPRSLLESLDVVSVQIQTRIKDKRVRRTKELIEIVGIDPHTRELLTNTVFVWNPTTDEFEYSGVSYVLERIQAERNWGPVEMREEWQRRKEILEWLIKRDVRDFQKVAKVIVAYYKEPQQVASYVHEDLARLQAEEAERARQAANSAAASQAPVEEPLAVVGGGAAGAAPGAPVAPGASAEGVPTARDALEMTLPAVIEEAAAGSEAEVHAMGAGMEAASAGLRRELLAEQVPNQADPPLEPPGPPSPGAPDHLPPPGQPLEPGMAQDQRRRPGQGREP